MRARSRPSLVLSVAVSLGLLLSTVAAPTAAAPTAAAPGAVAAPAPPAAPAPAAPLDPAGGLLRKKLERLLTAGKIDDALKTAGDAALAARATPGERAECVALYVSVARNLLQSHNFTRSEELLRKAVVLDDRNADATELLRQIAQARAETPAMLERADQFWAVERYAAAVRIYEKAVALLPEREPELRDRIRVCHQEAGDQHFRMANWGAALSQYRSAAERSTNVSDTARQLRRLQSAVLLAVEVLNRGSRLPDVVLAEMLTVGVDYLKTQPNPALAAMTAGLTAENLGQFERAATLYASLASQAVPAGDARTAAAKLRGAAASAIRKTLPRLGPESRPSLWQESLPGGWMIRETDRFVIHHHNDRIARRVADALEYYFVEALNDWELLLDRFVAWRPKLRVYLYRDEAEYRAATGIDGFVPAFGIKPRPGVKGVEPAIHLYQNHPGLLCSLLPHELTHMMLAYATDYPNVPVALDEGLALLSEPEQVRTFYHRAAMERAGAGGAAGAEPPTLAALLASGPAKDVESATRQYAHGLILAEYLRTRMAPTKLLETLSQLATAPGGDVRVLLAPAAGFRDPAELEADWRKFWGR